MKKTLKRWRARLAGSGVSRSWIRILARRDEEFRLAVMGLGSFTDERVKQRYAQVMGMRMARPISRPIGWKDLGRRLVTVTPMVAATP